MKVHGIVFGMVMAAALVIGESGTSVLIAGCLLAGALALQCADRYMRRRGK